MGKTVDQIDVTRVLGTADVFFGCLGKDADESYSDSSPRRFCRYFRGQIGQPDICAVAYLLEIKRQVKEKEIEAGASIIDPNQYFPMETTVRRFASEIAPGDSESEHGPSDTKHCKQGYANDTVPALIQKTLEEIG